MRLSSASVSMECQGMVNFCACINTIMLNAVIQGELRQEFGIQILDLI